MFEFKKISVILIFLIIVSINSSSVTAQTGETTEETTNSSTELTKSINTTSLPHSSKPETGTKSKNDSVTDSGSNDSTQPTETGYSISTEIPDSSNDTTSIENGLTSPLDDVTETASTDDVTTTASSVDDATTTSNFSDFLLVSLDVDKEYSRFQSMDSLPISSRKGTYCTRKGQHYTLEVNEPLYLSPPKYGGNCKWIVNVEDKLISYIRFKCKYISIGDFSSLSEVKCLEDALILQDEFDESLEICGTHSDLTRVLTRKGDEYYFEVILQGFAYPEIKNFLMEDCYLLGTDQDISRNSQ